MGCIAEFNPFHNGHEYLLSEAKKLTGATHTVIVMSEYFTQRGEPALLHSLARTEMALASGADLVLSLPVSFALSSAEKFAFGGVYILNALSCVDSLAFGSECGDNTDILRLARAVKSCAFTDKIKRNSAKNITYAALREKILKDIITDLPPEKISGILNNPNDILAVEYNKALLSLSSNIIPTAVKRMKVSHDSDNFADSFASASLIRKLIISGESYEQFLPASSCDVIQRETQRGRILHNDYGYRILPVLRRLKTGDLIGIDDVGEGIENRIITEVAKAESLVQLYDSVKTKRYTHSRIRRIIMNAYIGVTSQAKPAAIKVLGFNKKGAEILHKAKKISSLPIITKPADYDKANRDISVMTKNESKAAAMFGVLCRNIIPMGEEYKNLPLIF